MPVYRKDLSDEELAEVQNWLKVREINPMKVRREFSDVKPLAQLLVAAYPKYIELYNYPKKNGVQQKLNNWITFNQKVLTKLGFTLSRSLMQDLANGEAGAIEVLIYEFIKLERKARAAEVRAAEARQEKIWMDNDEVRTVIVAKQVGDGIIQVPQKMILFSIYEALLRETQAKDHILEASRNKIEHLENILKLKKQRIEELLVQMNKLISQVPCTNSMGHESDGSRIYRVSAGGGDGVSGSGSRSGSGSVSGNASSPSLISRLGSC